MEELWKDFTTHSSSHHHHHHYQPTTATAAVSLSPFHDFLASPLFPPTQSCESKTASWSVPQVSSNKLSSRKGTDHNLPGQQLYASFPCSYSPPVPAVGFSSSLFPQLVSPNRGSDDDSACSDRRYKRKMKNRESATRSRARRQAYTNELERELAQLREENAMLRRRQEQMSSAAAAAASVPQKPKKTKLRRSLTA